MSNCICNEPASPNARRDRHAAWCPRRAESEDPIAATVHAVARGDLDPETAVARLRALSHAVLATWVLGDQAEDLDPRPSSFDEDYLPF